MQRPTKLLATALLVGLSLAAGTRARAQITLGHVDDFQDGTTQGWMINPLGMGVPPAAAFPVVIPNGGPGGAGDAFLQLHSVGGTPGLPPGAPQPGSRLTAINPFAQWAGNYTAAGVNTIALDARNPGSTDLALRFLLENPTFVGPPTDIGISTTPILLPAGSGWTHLLFPLALTPLTPPVGGTSNLAALLSNVTAIRLFHSPGLADNGPRVVATLDVDNITALATPEPTSLALLAGGAALLLGLGRRRARR
jgi:hypothetical protein